MPCDYCKAQPIKEIPVTSYFGGSQWKTMHAEVAAHGEVVVYDADRRPVCRFVIAHCPFCGRALGSGKSFRVLPCVEREVIEDGGGFSGDTAEDAAAKATDAWNSWVYPSCENCCYKKYADEIGTLPGCNTCGKKMGQCACMPRLGETCRINCPLWVPKTTDPPEVPLTEDENHWHRLVVLGCKDYPDCARCLCSECSVGPKNAPYCCQPYQRTAKIADCVSFLADR